MQKITWGKNVPANPRKSPAKRRKQAATNKSKASAAEKRKKDFNKLLKAAQNTLTLQEREKLIDKLKREEKQKNTFRIWK